jgi:hypothetical protein
MKVWCEKCGRWLKLTRRWFEKRVHQAGTETHEVYLVPPVRR